MNWWMRRYQSESLLCMAYQWDLWARSYSYFDCWWQLCGVIFCRRCAGHHGVRASHLQAVWCSFWQLYYHLWSSLLVWSCSHVKPPQAQSAHSQMIWSGSMISMRRLRSFLTFVFDWSTTNRVAVVSHLFCECVAEELEAIYWKIQPCLMWGKLWPQLLVSVCRRLQVAQRLLFACPLPLPDCCVLL